MRHHRSGKKLGRDSSHRKALYSNLAGALIEHGRIRTTEAKAKAVKPEVERLITLGAKRLPREYGPDDDFVKLEDPDGNHFCVVQKDNA